MSEISRLDLTRMKIALEGAKKKKQYVAPPTTLVLPIVLFRFDS